jgi:GNAT superfamily N-acetyltransferase
LRESGATTTIDSELTFLKVNKESELPAWADRVAVAKFLHETMEPYNDPLEYVQAGLDYAFSEAEGKGGFIMLVRKDDRLAGACLMLETGMKGYVPETLLLMVSVAPELRGQGVGRILIERCLAECRGSVKLHVEYDNPARRLYERVGFTSKYAEMRWENESRHH